MRVLVIAPDQPGINAVPEVRRLQAWHDCAILYGTVTEEDIFRACQEKGYDVLHFATHGGPDGLALSGGEMLTAEDLSQIVRLRETRGVFLNSCDTGKIGAYVVRHGAQWAISSEIQLPDGDAWKLAAAFYSHQRNGHSGDFVGAFVLADSGDGEYSLMVNPVWVQELQKAAALAATIPHTARPLTRQEATLWAVLLTLGAAGLTAALLFAAGRL